MREPPDKPTLVMAWGGQRTFDRAWLRRHLDQLRPECVVWNAANGANRFTIGWQHKQGQGQYLRILRSEILTALPELAATWRLMVVALPETATERRVIAAAERLGATIIRPASDQTPPRSGWRRWVLPMADPSGAWAGCWPKSLTCDGFARTIGRRRKFKTPDQPHGRGHGHCPRAETGL